MEPTSKKLFVSYSRKDKAMARRVADALEIQGYDVFWDAAIPPGQKFDTYIFSQLEQSDAVVVLWSTHSTASDYVKEEADYAKTNSVLVPLRIDKTSLPFGFARSASDGFVESFALFFAFLYGVGAVGLLASGVIWFAFEPVEAVKPKRTHVSASAILAIAIVMFMLLGIFVFALRLV